MAQPNLSSVLRHDSPGLVLHIHSVRPSRPSGSRQGGFPGGRNRTHQSDRDRKHRRSYRTGWSWRSYRSFKIARALDVRGRGFLRTVVRCRRICDARCVCSRLRHELRRLCRTVSGRRDGSVRYSPYRRHARLSLYGRWRGGPLGAYGDGFRVRYDGKLFRFNLGQFGGGHCGGFIDTPPATSKSGVGDAEATRRTWR